MNENIVMVNERDGKFSYLAEIKGGMLRSSGYDYTCYIDAYNSGIDTIQKVELSKNLDGLFKELIEI